MKNTCPKCDTAYNVTAAAVGRKFTCKNCGTPVVVTADGLDYQNPPAAAAPAAPANAFDFDAAEDERKSAKSAKKASKPAKARDEEPEDDGPRKPKPKKPRDEEPEDDEDMDRLPARKAKKGSDKNVLKDFLFFREFVAPLFVKLIFFISVAGIIFGGIGLVGFGLVTGKIEAILGGLCSAVIFVPLGILMVRIYCELVLLGFSVYDRLGEIKNLLEKGQATTPAAPPGPPTP